MLKPGLIELHEGFGWACIQERVWGGGGGGVIEAEILKKCFGTMR